MSTRRSGVAWRLLGRSGIAVIAATVALTSVELAQPAAAARLSETETTLLGSAGSSSDLISHDDGGSTIAKGRGRGRGKGRGRGRGKGRDDNPRGDDRGRGRRGRGSDDNPSNDDRGRGRGSDDVNDAPDDSDGRVRNDDRGRGRGSDDVNDDD
jgi:hypothetical protein